MRLIVSMLASGVIAGLLFLLMHGMIDQDHDATTIVDPGPQPNIHPEPRDETVNTRTREMPEEPEEPERPQTEPLDTNTPQRTPPDIEPIDIEFPSELEGPGIPTDRGPASRGGDGPVQVISQVRPEWPRRALTQGIEGWVRVQFTIRPDGSVSNARVVESQPGQLFDRAAVRAIERWKFRPRVVDGRPVERQATQLLEFNLEETGR